MFKRKRKLALMDEYIEIRKINLIASLHKYLDDKMIISKLKVLERKSKKLITSYKEVFLRLKCIDLSFSILEKQLANLKCEFNNPESMQDVQGNFGDYLNESSLQYYSIKLDSYSRDLMTKMKKLSFNLFEINHILSLA